MVREIYAAILPTQGLARTMPTGWGLPKASRRPNENALVSSVSLSKRLCFLGLAPGSEPLSLSQIATFAARIVSAARHGRGGSAGGSGGTAGGHHRRPCSGTGGTETSVPCGSRDRAGPPATIGVETATRAMSGGLTNRCATTCIQP